MEQDRRHPERSASLPTYANAVPGGSPPSVLQDEQSNNRKITLMALIDELTEMRDEAMGSQAYFPGEKKGSRPESMDDRFQIEGVAVFRNFESLVKSLDKELQNFANAARQLGSSVGLLSSGAQLRQRLSHLLFLFHDNAAELFPRKVKKEPISRPGGFRTKSRSLNFGAGTTMEELDPEALPMQLRMLATDLSLFVQCLNEFHEFSEEGVTDSMMNFHGDLLYWSSTLQEFKGQFRVKAVQRYVHELSTEMVEHIESVAATLATFIEVGVPTIRFAQTQASDNLLNLSTISAFFSGVTTTTLQYSFDKIDSPVAVAVNVFFFGSLVLSIAATVNSLLGLTWKHAMYRSPRHHVPWWVLIWIKRSPLIFLVVSVAAFSAGLVLFTYATQPELVARTTLVLTSFSSIGLVAVSFWIAAERWAFSKHRGRRWLGEVLAEFQRHLMKKSGLAWVYKVPLGAIMWTRNFLGRITSSAVRLWNKHRAHHEPGLPVTNPNVATSPSNAIVQEPQKNPPETPHGSPDEKVKPVVAATASDSQPESSSDTRTAKERFINAVRRIPKKGPTIMLGSSTLQRKGTAGSDALACGDPTPLKPTRIATLLPQLRQLRQEYVLDNHTGLVRHLQFSPNGKYLATCSWDRTTRIWQVPTTPDELFESLPILEHPSGLISQVAWSPDSSFLLTRLSRAIKIWTVTGKFQRTIQRNNPITCVTWLPDSKAFLCVEGCAIYTLDITGKVISKCVLDRLDLQDVTVTSDGQRLFAVASLIESSEGYKPVRSRPEKRIVVYNLQKKAVEVQVPILNDVRAISISPNGQLALVSYENKTPPQLWRVKENRLALLQTYMSKNNVEFAGTSYLSGPGSGDELVYSPIKGGEVLIFDRENGGILHSVRCQTKDITSVAWNHASPSLMLASGSQDGTVTIWTTLGVGASGPGSGESSLLLDRGESRHGKDADGHLYHMTASPTDTQLDLHEEDQDRFIDSPFTSEMVDSPPPDSRRSIYFAH